MSVGFVKKNLLRPFTDLMHKGVGLAELAGVITILQIDGERVFFPNRVADHIISKSSPEMDGVLRTSKTNDMLSSVSGNRFELDVQHHVRDRTAAVVVKSLIMR